MPYLPLFRVSLISIFIIMLFVDNFRAWNVAGSFFFPTKYFFEPLNYHQYGWGMYSFDLKEVRALRLQYTFADGSSETVDSPYGHIPSFKKTLLGNFDQALMADSSKASEQYLAKYLCKKPPKQFGDAPTSVSIQHVVRKVPQLMAKAGNDGQIIRIIDSYLEKCI